MAGTNQEMLGKVQTVLGVIDAEDLGVTLPHEHLLGDVSLWFTEPKEAGLRKLAYEPVSIANRDWIVHNTLSNLDQLRFWDEDVAIEEVLPFKKEGGRTIVELSNVSIGRDPLGLARISRATGLNIVMGSGYYVGEAQGPDYDRKTEEEIAREIIADIQVGVGDTGVCAGIIGEIGCSYPLHDREKKCLRAVVQAQRQTGAAINIHPGWSVNSPIEIIRMLDEAGANISRVVMSHLDLIVHPFGILCELAETGCYLEYDFFGGYLFNPPSWRSGPRPCDRERIEQIFELIHQGYLKQILISHDLGTKARLVRYGGGGYAHILRNIVPQMLIHGITREEIHTIMVENPKRMLQFVTANTLPTG